MASENIYSKCLPVLNDASLDDEEKTDEIEALICQDPTIAPEDVQSTVLHVLRRHRNAGEPPKVTSVAQRAQSTKARQAFESTVSSSSAEAKKTAHVLTGFKPVTPSSAEDLVQTEATEMSSFDMLRSVLGPDRSDEEISTSLESHGFDLGATMASLMTDMASQPGDAPKLGGHAHILVGKSMSAYRPLQARATERDQTKTVCRYFLSNGECLRADCRFRHDFDTQICKFWLAGNCLAGTSCIFSHDPSSLAQQIKLGRDDARARTIQSADFAVNDDTSFPSLGSSSTKPGVHIARTSSTNTGSGSLSSHADENEAFPSLAAVSSHASKKKQRERQNKIVLSTEHYSKQTISEIVRQPPPAASTSSQSNAAQSKMKTLARANRIPAPQHIPWLDTGSSVSQGYLAARQEAFEHGAMRNQFLQSAAQAWQRNDGRAAKSLSLRGQSENDLMRQCHRKAAHTLYESRNKHNHHSSAGAHHNREVFVDLHGLHPKEALEFLEVALLDHGKHTSPPAIYAIVGTGHHSKLGKDKVGAAVREWLSSKGYAFREFSAGGDRNNAGGILGIDPRTH